MKSWCFNVVFSFLLWAWQVCRFTTQGSQTPASSVQQNGIHNNQSHATVTYNSTMLFLMFWGWKTSFGDVTCKNVPVCYLRTYYYPSYSLYYRLCCKWELSILSTICSKLTEPSDACMFRTWPFLQLMTWLLWRNRPHVFRYREREREFFVWDGLSLVHLVFMRKWEGGFLDVKARGGWNEERKTDTEASSLLQAGILNYCTSPFFIKVTKAELGSVLFSLWASGGGSSGIKSTSV